MFRLSSTVIEQRSLSMSVFWLALAAFAIGTEAFVIVGLLPVIAADVHISLAATGQLVTVYALTYAIGSPVLAVLFNDFDRKAVLTLALCCFILGNLVAATAGDFSTLLVSRMMMALGAGLCMPTANAVAVAMASPERRGRAIALVTSGLTVATVMGVPIGTLVGSQFGWRATFVLVAILGAVALAGLQFGLPRGLPRTAATLAQRFAIARHGGVLQALGVTVLWAAGAVGAFTYLAVPLHSLGFSVPQIGFALLLSGTGAAAGNLLGGTFVDRKGPFFTATSALAVVVASLTLQSVALKFAPPEFAAAIFLALMFIQSVAGWMFYPAQVSNLLHLAPDAPMIALSLNASAMYLGIAVGGAAIGAVVAGLPVYDIGWICGISVLAALALHLFRESRQRLKLAQIAG
jgi:predicted MFS family arabinose efflux permease